MNALQSDLFEPTIAQQFEAWKQTPGAGHVLAAFYRKAAGFFSRFKCSGVGCSQRLIEELTRDEIRRNELRGITWQGYSLNSHFTAHIVRHMLREHPEWHPMFELRALNAARYERKVLVITQPLRPAAHHL